MTAHHTLKSALRAASVALVTTAVVGTGAPALAAGTHLCDGYKACSDRGMTASGYGLANDRSYWRMYPGHNCTNYAAYRMIRSGMGDSRPWSGGGNAIYWGQHMSSITDDTPRVGAIAWWNDGSPGHVAYVEKVISSSEIIISQDSWGGDFSWARVTRDDRWPAGFIHFNDRRMDSQAAPQVFGAVKVGSTLRASSGSWTPSPSRISYTWKMGGKVLPAATRSTLRVTPRMLDRQVQVIVSAGRYGYPTTRAASQKTARVLPGQLTATQAPDLSGSAEVNRTMSVTTGRWSPRPGRVTTQWQVDGKDVEGATGNRFPLTSRHAGHRISVVVTARRYGYAPVTRTFTTSAVNRAPLTLTRRSTVTGHNIQRQVLQVTPGAVRQQATRHITWLRDGQPVAGANATTYALTRRDVRRHISARVTWTRPGYRPMVDETRGRYIRGILRLETHKTRLRRGVLFDITAKVAGQRLSEPTRVVVRNGGRVRATGLMREGHVRIRVTGMPRGHRTLWFYFAPTGESINRAVSRRAYFR